MNMKDYKKFSLPVILFFAGLIVLVGIFSKINAFSLKAISLNFFVLWFEVLSIYFVLWFPFYFCNKKGFHVEEVSVKKALWICAIIYCAIAIFTIIGLLISVMRIDVAILINFLIFFLFVLNVSLALSWQKHLYRSFLSMSEPKKNIEDNLLTRIALSLDSLAERSSILSSSYDEEKERIKQLPLLARSLPATTMTEAAVMEQNIMSRLTAFTAAYEKVLSGSEADVKAFRQTLSDLESLINQRAKMK